jgi:hypothetical protein
LVMTLNQQTLRNMPIQKSYFHDFGWINDPIV